MPGLQAIKKKLASKDDGERFEAVFEVLDNRIKEALPYVVPLIEDPDPFVQIGAMQSVGEFLYMTDPVRGPAPPGAVIARGTFIARRVRE